MSFLGAGCNLMDVFLFLGAGCKLMECSGLEELWGEVYAHNS